MQVHILVGASGSGKSTWAKGFEGDKIVVSADDYFMRRDGSYAFDPSKIGAAHQECLRNFTRRLGVLSLDTLIVDNTNTTVLEAAPYIALGLAHCADVMVHVFPVDYSVGAARNVHGVPANVVQRMGETIAEEWPTRLPYHWQPENEPRMLLATY
jgi:predicted kinase